MSVGEYFSGMIVASVLASLVGALLPTAKDGGVTKAAELLISLCLIAVIVLPLGGVLSGVGDIFDSFDKDEVTLPEGGDSLDGLYGSLVTQSREEIEAEIVRRLRAEFSLPENGVEVYAEVNYSDGQIRLLGVTVYLRGAAMWEDPHAIKNYVEKMTEAPCEVVTGR